MSESTAPRVGPAWGDNITKKRQRELDGYLAAWDADADHGARKSPFDGPPDESFDRRLTGADVFYLAARSLVGTKQDYPVFEVLDEASDEDVDEYTISNIDEARTLLREPGGAFGLKLTGLNLQGANLIGAQLAGAYLVEARLDHTILGAANLEGAYLRDARLAEADLRSADLEGTHLEGAQLTGADLGGARLDRDTRLNDASLVGIFVDQIALDNTNLNVLSWERCSAAGRRGRGACCQG
jgi:Pentapeptide repeats (8 copies)